MFGRQPSPPRAFAAGALLLWALGAAASQAQGRYDPRREKTFPEFIKLTLKPWYATGRAEARSSFQLGVLSNPNLPKNEASFGTTFEFTEDRNLMILSALEVRPLRWLFLEFEYGNTANSHGLSFRHDWIDAENYSILFLASGIQFDRPDYQDFSLLRSASQGQSSYVGANIYFRVLSTRTKVRVYEEDELRHDLDLFGGYFWSDDRYRMRDGFRALSRFNPASEGPVSGLASSYLFHYEGGRLGLRETVTLPKRLELLGRASYSPGVRYLGEGRLNLSTGLQQSPSFTDRAHNGQVMEFSLSLAHSPVRYLSLHAGYLWQYFRSGAGTSTDHLANGSDAFGDLDFARIDRTGWSFGMSVQY